MPPKRHRKAGVGVGVVGLGASWREMKGSASNRKYSVFWVPIDNIYVRRAYRRGKGK